MPGPCNSKKKRQQLAKKKERQVKAQRDGNVQTRLAGANEYEDEVNLDASVGHHPITHVGEQVTETSRAARDEHRPPEIENASASENSTSSISEQPFITDPGNGPRVKDVSAYLSSFFAIPPDVKEPTCAAFAAPGVLEMLLMALPREVAIITWFNKTRLFGRICPACQRIYKLGDTLLDPVSNVPLDPRDPSTPKHVFFEQEISGICSSTCFLLASYSSHPHITEVMRGAFGRREDEIDNDVFNMLGATDLTTATMIMDGPGSWKLLLREARRTLKDGDVEFSDQGLGRVMRLTRCEDLGLRVFDQSLSKVG